mmetsp:Transcript_32297/g.75862  ORF Transcript_32297/g.75862 Transcript_32297/m.75862 type:complete len:218 (+) Transcript_32297:1171-1824(+)
MRSTESRQAETEAVRASEVVCPEESGLFAKSASSRASVARDPLLLPLLEPVALATLPPRKPLKAAATLCVAAEPLAADATEDVDAGFASAKCWAASSSALACARACCRSVSTCSRHSNKWSTAGSSTFISNPSLRSASKRSHVNKAAEASRVCRAVWPSSATVCLATVFATAAEIGTFGEPPFINRPSWRSTLATSCASAILGLCYTVLLPQLARPQ